MTHAEDQLNLHAARLYLTRLLPHQVPFTQQELQSLTLKAGLWSLHRQAQLAELTLTDQLQAHVRLLRGQGSDLDQRAAQQLRRGDQLSPPRLIPVQEDAAPQSFGADLERMQQQAHRLRLPWFTRQRITQAKAQVSYRVTEALERALHDAWMPQAPRGGSRNDLQATLALAYLSLPKFKRRVQQLQDARYANTPLATPSEEARKIAALLARCHIPARGAPTLRNDVVQLSYRVTVTANALLKRSLPGEERTLAYLHIDLLALYLTAPDIRTFVDQVIEDRAQK